MKRNIRAMILVSIAVSFLQGCAGVRNSYVTQLDASSDDPLLRVEKGEVVEVLSVGNGFPGWWGYYPGVKTSAPNVASVECKPSRSMTPFREPGVVFGGEVCHMLANEVGEATLFFGNKFNLSAENHEERVSVEIYGHQGSERQVPDSD